jgi:hypothetical protein
VADKPGEPESLAEVLASIRALVSAETESRTGGAGSDPVLVLSPEMRVRVGSTGGLAEGMEVPPEGSAAPILDEESLRAVINAIVREELQGELGDPITRNLRKLVRQEIAQVLDEQRKA